MSKQPYYSLQIQQARFGDPAPVWETVVPFSRPVLLRDIPAILAYHLVGGHRYTYSVTMYTKDCPIPTATLDGVSNHFETVYDSQLPKQLQVAFELSVRRLNSDRLYMFDVELLRLFKEDSSGFEVKSVGSDRGYVRSGETVLTVRKLCNETVLKECTKWTTRYMHVVTWRVKNPAEMLELCQEQSAKDRRSREYGA